MENKLDIRKEISGHEQHLFLEGRLDANWAGHLDDYLNDLVREGSHRILLNMHGVQYLSSAGIRILVNQYKKIKKIGGLFCLVELSGAVAEVLNMVGMSAMLTEWEADSADRGNTAAQIIEIAAYKFENEVLSDESMTFLFRGNPELSLTSGYLPADNHKIKNTANRYGLGIGAIGDGFDDCKTRYGEYLSLGNALVYKPTDGSKIPDYAVKSGNLNPEINALCSLQAEGSFSNRITFDPTGGTTSISMKDMVTGFAKTTGFHQFVFLAIAESEGLVGVSLSAPPVGGKLLFELPGIRDHINFTTEPAHSKMLTLSLGFYALHPDDQLKPYLRQDKPGSDSYVHIHTAIFPFQSLPKKANSAEELILHLFDSSIVQDVMHLVNDSREIVGLGDSSFKQGIAWIGKLGKS
jgi:anti-anti-sigma factor